LRVLKGEYLRGGKRTGRLREDAGGEGNGDLGEEEWAEIEGDKGEEGRLV
jgi:hypothetical protein